MKTFDTTRMVDFSAQSVLYWYGISKEKGTLAYCLMLNGEVDVVSTKSKENAFGSAEYLMIPIICIN